MDTLDVIVVGLGPAGSSAAYQLARRGHRVLGLEKHEMPRYKPCWGCLSRRVEKVLDEDFRRLRETVRLDVGAIPFGYGWVFPKQDHWSVGVGSGKSLARHPNVYYSTFLKDQRLEKEILQEKLGWRNNTTRPCFPGGNFRGDRHGNMWSA